MTAEEAIKLDKAKFAVWSQAAPTEELQRVFAICAMSTHSQFWKVVELELQRRQYERLLVPHWTVTPAFWIAMVAMVFSAIAAWPIVRDWFR